MRRRKPRKPRPRASTAARGYGYPHEKLKKQLLAAWRPGQLCVRCGEPMWERWTLDRSGRRMSAIHLGHNDDRTAWTGLEHAHCNLSDGARRGNAMRGVAAVDGRIARHSRTW